MAVAGTIGVTTNDGASESTNFGAVEGVDVSVGLGMEVITTTTGATVLVTAGAATSSTCVDEHGAIVNVQLMNGEK